MTQFNFFKKGTVVVTIVRCDSFTGSTAVHGVVLNGKNKKLLNCSGHDSGRDLEMIASRLSSLGAKWYRGHSEGGHVSYEEVPNDEFSWRPCDAPAGAPR